MRKEKELIYQQQLRQDLLDRKMDRREFISKTLTAGLGLAGVGVISNFGNFAQAQSRPLTPTFYQWIEDLHPGIPQVNSRFPDVNYQIAPVEGFGIERFVAEAKKKDSTWDVYVGQTPFVEMTAMIEADVIEPWDNYIPKDVIDDIIPSIREECTINGKMYGWPFLLDVIGTGWHAGIVKEAGLPDGAPVTWQDYLSRADQVIESGAAPFGATFDANGWRSLAPFTHSLSSDVYTSEGLFDFTGDAAIEALMLMKNIMSKSHPDIMLAGTSDGGVNGTPDEVAFAAQRVGYYNKYFNAPLRMAQYWDNPKDLRMGPLPKFAGGEGSTVFWTTGAALFKHGKNKEKAAEYVKALTYTSKSGKIRLQEPRPHIQDNCLHTSLSMPDGNQVNLIGYPTSWTSSVDSWTRPRRSPITSSASNSFKLANQFGNLTSRVRKRIQELPCRKWLMPFKLR